MMEQDFTFAMLVQAGLALLFLLVGWRLGRESAGRAMFDQPLLSRTSETLPEEADPWAEAALDMEGARHAVDSFSPNEPERPGSSMDENHHLFNFT